MILLAEDLIPLPSSIVLSIPLTYTGASPSLLLRRSTPNSVSSQTLNMPVATSTMVTSSVHSPSAVDFIKNHSPVYGTLSKGSKVKQSRALDKVYHRAARAFLNRNVALTHQLLDTGFKSLEGAGLNTTYLWKWDILRITFDTTLYTSPPSSSASHIPFMNEILSKSPQSFVEDMYTRSRNMFQQSENNATAALPAQILSTLVYSSLKVDAPDVGRRMIEDWLASRGDTTDLSLSWTSTSTSLTDNSMSDGYDADGSGNGDSPVDVGLVKGSDGYAKILELYCLQVLPKLGQWEYAMGFMEYECELELEPRDVSFDLRCFVVKPLTCNTRRSLHDPCNLYMLKPLIHVFLLHRVRNSHRQPR